MRGGVVTILPFVRIVGKRVARKPWGQVGRDGHLAGMLLTGVTGVTDDGTAGSCFAKASQDKLPYPTLFERRVPGHAPGERRQAAAVQIWQRGDAGWGWFVVFVRYVEGHDEILAWQNREPTGAAEGELQRSHEGLVGIGWDFGTGR
jgi:hypothetical protein